MNRYLLNLAYIGTRFWGAQKQVSNSNLYKDDPRTIQGRLEIGLKQLKSVNYPYVVISSRTDAGVHALHSTVHVDLERKNGLPYEPKAITLALNKYFNQTDTPIRIISTFLVPSDFHCRVAESRTYMYRLSVIKADYTDTNSLTYHIPIEEINRSLYISTSTFDLDKLEDACKLIRGWHDFRSFMGKGSRQPDKVTRRTIDKLEIQEVDNPCHEEYSWPKCGTSRGRYRHFKIFITSKGFLYNQVRRTVGALIAVAKGKVTTRDLKFMLEVPSHNSWDPRIKPVPAHGLYLCEVAYPASARATFKSTLEQESC